MCNAVKRQIGKYKERFTVLVWLYIQNQSFLCAPTVDFLKDVCIYGGLFCLPVCVSVLLSWLWVKGGLSVMAFQLFMHTSGWDASVQTWMKAEWLLSCWSTWFSSGSHPACVSVAISHLQVDRLLTSAVLICDYYPTQSEEIPLRRLSYRGSGEGNRPFVVMLDFSIVLIFILFWMWQCKFLIELLKYVHFWLAEKSTAGRFEKWI